MTTIAKRLEDALGRPVLTDRVSRVAHCRDTWVLSELRDLEDRIPSLPAAVVEAESTEDVVKVLVTCRAARVPVVPYGGGSGVCGGIVAPEGSVVLSTRRMSGLVELDDTSLCACFAAGTNGLEAERRVSECGLTIGNWPQSIELSSVGGWVATRASGQYSTGYGSIEDLLLDLEAVLPDGSVLRTVRTPRASAGPDLRQLFLGSEGTLGVVTQVSFSLRPLPEARRGQAFHFARFHEGLEPIRRLVRDGWRPPVVRLYDAAESKRHFEATCPEERAMLLLLHEGPAAYVDTESAAVSKHCREAGGREADPATVDTWLEHRNRVPGFRGFLEKGIVVDTIEVAATWDRVAQVYDRVTEALRAVPGVLVATSHSSHSYRSGTCLYFTFAARPERREDMEATYRACWQRAMQTVTTLGAGISHHHGIGRVRREALARELGESGVALLRAVKRALDPEDLLNPGALLPEADAPR